jgi:hypothetical protein
MGISRPTVSNVSPSRKNSEPSSTNDNTLYRYREVIHIELVNHVI